MNMFDLTGRVAVVTGGNGGIGLGMAKGMAEAGAAVVIAGRNEEKNQAAIASIEAVGGTATSVVADVTDEGACAAMIETAVSNHGGLHILVNNAGINVRKEPQEMSLDEWNQVMDVNMTGAFLASKAAYQPMRDAGFGKIINIGSMMSIFGASFVPAYAASKGGIVQFTKATAAAWARHNIQVNAVLPGWINTDLTRRAREEVKGLHERVLARTPAGRWGEPEDHAGIAVFLAGPGSDFVTGTAIPVDGGFSSLG